MSPTSVRYDTGPTIAVAVADYTAAWNDGHFVGDKPLVEFAENMADGAVELPIFGQVITASYTDPLGALAAMAGYWPGRVVVTQAPPEVYEAIATSTGDIPESEDAEDDDADDDHGIAPDDEILEVIEVDIVEDLPERLGGDR